MKHAIANAEDATSRYSLSTKVLAVFLSIAMVVTFSHFNAFAEFIQGGAKDDSFVQVKTSLENVVITDTSTQVSYKQADVDALGYLPAAADKVVTFTVTPYDNAATPGPDYTLSEVSYAGGALSPNASGQYSFTPVEGAKLVVKAVAVAAETPAAVETEKPAATDDAEGAATTEDNKGAEASDASQGAASTNNSNDAANAAAGTDSNKGAAEPTGAVDKTPQPITLLPVTQPLQPKPPRQTQLQLKSRRLPRSLLAKLLPLPILRLHLSRHPSLPRTRSP